MLFGTFENGTARMPKQFEPAILVAIREERNARGADIWLAQGDPIAPLDFVSHYFASSITV